MGWTRHYQSNNAAITEVLPLPRRLCLRFFGLWVFLLANLCKKSWTDLYENL